MEYLNKKTGFKFDSKFKISGGDWELVTAKTEEKEVLQEEIPVEPTFVPEKKSSEEKVDTSSEVPTGNSDFDSITKKDIIQELDSMGIEYNPKAKKQELFDLMMGK